MINVDHAKTHAKQVIYIGHLALIIIFLLCAGPDKTHVVGVTDAKCSGVAGSCKHRSAKSDAHQPEFAIGKRGCLHAAAQDELECINAADLVPTKRALLNWTHNYMFNSILRFIQFALTTSTLKPDRKVFGRLLINSAKCYVIST